jgi:putative glycosyltransferase
MKLSIVATLYHSASYIEEFYQRSCKVAETITRDYEIILVNDGSPDHSLDVARGISERDAKVVVVDLSRNFGHHKAIMTGLSYAQGDLVMLIDVDLEEPPEILRSFYQTFQNSDADVVYGVAGQREGSAFRRASGRAYYSLYNWLSQYPVPHDALSARLMTKRYVQRLLQHKEQLFSIDGLMEITGFKQIPVEVEKHYKGSTTYSFRKRIGLAVSGITSLSNKPLIYIAYLGLVMTIPSGILIIYLMFQYLLGITDVSGWTSVIVSLWFLGGLIIFIMGIIAVYLSVIFVEIKARPYTVVRDVYRQHADNQPNGVEQSYAEVDRLRQPQNTL